MVELSIILPLVLPVEHFLDRKSLFQVPNVVFGERVGHPQPVSAVVHAGVPVRVPTAHDDLACEELILDGAENAGELAREVNRFRHASIIQARNDTVNRKTRKTFHLPKWQGLCTRLPPSRPPSLGSIRGFRRHKGLSRNVSGLPACHA